MSFRLRLLSDMLNWMNLPPPMLAVVSRYSKYGDLGPHYRWSAGKLWYTLSYNKPSGSHKLDMQIAVQLVSYEGHATSDLHMGMQHHLACEGVHRDWPVVPNRRGL